MDVWLIVVGLLVHVVFFFSIFDIYFTSPLVHGMTPHATPLEPPARRLVLFVADGLRADKLYEVDESGHTRAPYLRSVIEQQGSWGVSHTRVPTESRPGHVALIAGFYEDVSAVAKGWKENPVQFDSVFNESRYTWSWGSPDILPMFAKGASGNHVFVHTYPAGYEDFADEDASRLDTWVFNKVKEFVQDMKQNDTLSRMVSSDRIVLFLHLLGIDTNGHAHKPFSKEYLANIGLVDSGIREAVELIEDAFQRDGKTAYMMTADHGMTNWGSHGAGHPHETLTPIVAWGAGVNRPAKSGNAQDYPDGFSQLWKLDHLKRQDMSQADIAALMASLIGVPFPLNSVGVLPLGFLDNTKRYKVESLLTNAQQILAQYEVKEKHMQETTLAVFFSPFKPLSVGKKADVMRTIRAQISKGQPDEAISTTHDLIQRALDGLNYYHNYDRFLLGTSILMGYLGWMAYILQHLLSFHTSLPQPRRTKLDGLGDSHALAKRGPDVIFTTLAAVIVVLLTIQSSPLMYYVYCLLPVPLWYTAAKQYRVFYRAISHTVSTIGFCKVIGYLVLGVIAMEIVVLSMFWREVLSLGLVGIALWPFFTELRKHSKGLVAGWTVSCLAVAVFPMLPVVGRDANINLVTLAGVLFLLSSLAALLYLRAHRRPPTNPIHPAIGPLQLLILLLSVYIVNSTWASLANKRGLPLTNQCLSWAIFGSSFLIPGLTSLDVVSRLLSTAMAFAAVFLLTSTSHEGLFCIALCYLMFFWLLCEHRLSQSSKVKLIDLSFGEESTILSGPPRRLVLDDVRCAYFFIFFILTAFFGTGNIASINSFDPASVYCFLTVFSPFVMGSLLLWKIVILFLLVTCTFKAIHLLQRLPNISLFLVVLLLSDGLALQFFFLVRDSGSWLDIGTSISHYVIVMCMIIFVMLLLVLARLFTTVTFGLGQRRKAHST
ncbi:GPI ethanolamine phosphate transferase 1-like [Patiria miniata]|uniref:GPI ethanolamine phosphate transferase 1 n=1 Tax=Patiria miniata TaxID=46514 RepID=A0A914BPK4_PATMI|nr:GPI ethanolamine phosphate transferase 1-like [Patiria miniata]